MASSRAGPGLLVWAILWALYMPKLALRTKVVITWFCNNMFDGCYLICDSMLVCCGLMNY